MKTEILVYVSDIVCLLHSFFDLSPSTSKKV